MVHHVISPVSTTSIVRYICRLVSEKPEAGQDPGAHDLRCHLSKGHLLWKHARNRQHKMLPEREREASLTLW